MNKIEGFKPQESKEGKKNLPVGAYVGKIVDAKVEEYKTKDSKTISKLVIALDVSEGEHKDFYMNQYKDASGRESKYPVRYKGTIRYALPSADDPYAESHTRKLENAVWAVEQSNEGYHWDWNEKALKGKTVGFCVREFDWLLDDGRKGTSTEIGKLVSAQDVREGKVKPMPKRELSERDKARAAAIDNEIHGLQEADEEPLPF